MSKHDQPLGVYACRATSGRIRGAGCVRGACLLFLRVVIHAFLPSTHCIRHQQKSAYARLCAATGTTIEGSSIDGGSQGIGFSSTNARLAEAASACLLVYP